MAASKTKSFSEKDLKIASFAKALSHPARIAILKALADKQECLCGDLVADLPLAQSTVSQHLKALKEIGLIKGKMSGPKSLYRINWKIFEKFQMEMSFWSAKMITLRKDNDR